MRIFAVDSHREVFVRFRFSAVLLCVLVATVGCTPSPPQAAPAPADWASDEAAILALTRESSAAWNRGDLAGHLAIYVDSVTFMTREGPRPGVAAIEEAFKRSYFREDGMPKQQLRFEQASVRPLGRDAALHTARFVLSGGGEPDRSGWFTLVWMRTPAGWRAVHDHSS